MIKKAQHSGKRNTSKMANVWDTANIRDVLAALQADICIDRAVSLVSNIKEKPSSTTRPLPTPHQVAVELMSGMVTANGSQVQWRVPKPGQKYPPSFRALLFC